MTKKVLCKFLTFFACSLSVHARAADLVYGKGFSFSVEEPKGWTCDCDGAQAATIKANVAIYRKGESFQTAQPLIYIRVNDRHQSAAGDLKTDIQSVQNSKPSMKFGNMKFEVPNAETAASSFEGAGGLTEYVTYVYPHESRKNSLSVTMHFDKRKATKGELEAYRSILSSLRWVSDKEPTVKSQKK